MDKIEHMRAFLRVADRLSFSKAADDLGISPAYLSRQTAALEKRLGLQLLRRNTRHVNLTPHGQECYDIWHKLVADIDAADRKIAELGDKTGGVMQVNAPVSFGLTSLTAPIAEFSRTHPDVSLSVTFDDRVLGVVQEGFDLAIRIRKSLPDSSLHAMEVGTTRQYLCANPRYLERAGHPQSPEDLRNHMIIGYSLSSDAQLYRMCLDGEETTVRVETRHQVGNSLFLRDLVVAGEGIGSLPCFAAEPHLLDGSLVKVLPQYKMPCRTIYVVTPHRISLDVNAMAFAQILKRHREAQEAARED